MTWIYKSQASYGQTLILLIRSKHPFYRLTLTNNNIVITLFISYVFRPKIRFSVVSFLPQFFFAASVYINEIPDSHLM